MGPRVNSPDVALNPARCALDRIGNRSLMDADHTAKKYLIIDTG